MLKVYQYPNCSSCRKALHFLNERGVSYETINIVEEPPKKYELRSMLSEVGGEKRRLFNTSGELYRSLNIKDKLPSMTTKEAVDLLAKHGKLIKRPFVVGEQGMAVGFDQEEWEMLLDLFE